MCLAFVDNIIITICARPPSMSMDRYTHTHKRADTFANAFTHTRDRTYSPVLWVCIRFYTSTPCKQQTQTNTHSHRQTDRQPHMLLQRVCALLFIFVLALLGLAISVSSSSNIIVCVFILFVSRCCCCFFFLFRFFFVVSHNSFVPPKAYE